MDTTALDKFINHVLNTNMLKPEIKEFLDKLEALWDAKPILAPNQVITYNRTGEKR